ncbi:aminodeoxychorismate synthase, component I [Bacillus massiliigorillae]|uniref:aminodeoxychorismate synthase, component I n=1 Tax=Bacillus massiliigorillae TaxID=1243664 RepID=UPI00039CF23D|nr:aminodeoxychorismate synthase, component I [Bacillus massiliigorillae]
MRQVFNRKIPFKKEDFFHAYKVLSYKSEHHIILESGRGGKYSICGIHAHAVIEGYHNRLVVSEQGQEEIISGDPLLSMKQWMRQREVAFQQDLPDFQGGAIGFISYDYARYIENLPMLAEDDLETPILYFLVFDEVALFDHEEEVLWLMMVGHDEDVCQRRLEEMEHQFVEASSRSQELHFDLLSENDGDLEVSMTEQQFKDAVDKVKAYIAQGDIFQVNLSVRQSKQLVAHPLEIYTALRELNPSPYMSYLQTPYFQVVSGSPELLVKKKRRAVSTRPIAGTRSRGKNEIEDEQLADELIQNEKERAEHVMLVDLERNDLGRVCEYGTVEVNEFMVIEKYSHVMHIVSNVRGSLAASADEYDVIRATFPGGTITGAPKVRTMEIIEELEPVRRGVYTGSIGWIGFNGDLELNIVIRTLFAKDGVGHIQAGAGIVIDSQPKHEYKESLKKAAAVWRAKELADEKALRKGEEQR